MKAACAVGLLPFLILGTFGDVVELTDVSHKSIEKGTEPWVVHYYSKTETMNDQKSAEMSVFLKYTSSVFMHEPQLKFGELNCAQYKRVCQDVDILPLGEDITPSTFPLAMAFHFPALEPVHKVNLVEYTQDSPILRVHHNFTKIAQWIETNFKGTSHKAVGKKDAPSDDVKPAALRQADAEAALLFALRKGAFQKGVVWNPVDKPEVYLAGEALDELKEWMKFLPSVFSSPESLAHIEHLAGITLNAGKFLGWSTWEAAFENETLGSTPIQAAKDPAAYFKLCKSYNGGFWSLFHLVAAAAADGRTGALRPNDAAERINGFVEHFLPPATEFSNLLAPFPDLERFKAGDSVGVVMWLWQLHNEYATLMAKKNNVAKAPWPSEEECGACWVKPGSEANLANLYAHIKDSFLEPRKEPEGFGFGLNFAKADQLALARNLLIGGGAIGAMVVLWLFYMYFQARERHAQEEKAFMDKFKDKKDS